MAIAASSSPQMNHRYRPGLSCGELECGIKGQSTPMLRDLGQYPSLAPGGERFYGHAQACAPHDRTAHSRCCAGCRYLRYLNNSARSETQRTSTRRQWMPWVTCCVLTLFV